MLNINKAAIPIVIGLLTLGGLQLRAQCTAAPVVPSGFTVTTLASGLNQPKGITSPAFRSGAEAFGDNLYVAESGLNQIDLVSKAGGATPFASSGGTFPVGIAISGGPFGDFLYAGNAFSGGLTRIDPLGTTTSFALPTTPVAGIDFGHGPYGHDMYVGLWTQGEIDRVDTSGNATVFATLPAGAQSRYPKFSHGGAFGTFLYVTDFGSGKIYQIDTAGASTQFSATGSFGLEGLDFSPGGVFGDFLYAGNLSTGQIFQIDPQGNSTVWGSGFCGVADIHFQPTSSAGGFVMYLVDGQLNGSVYAVSKQ